MWKQIKMQAELEKHDRRLLRNDLTMFFVSFCFFIACTILIPFNLLEDRDDVSLIVMSCGSLMVAINLINGPMTHFLEKNRSVNIFRKMRYVPIDFKIYIGAKLYLMWKELVIIAAIYQLPALSIRYAAHMPVITPYAFFPLYTVLFAGIVETAHIFINYFLRNKSDILV